MVCQRLIPTSVITRAWRKSHHRPSFLVQVSATTTSPSTNLFYDDVGVPQSSKKRTMSTEAAVVAPTICVEGNEYDRSSLMVPLPATMRAVLASGPGPSGYRLIKSHPTPRMPLEDEVVIRVTAVGICASDAKMYQGADFYWGENGRVSKPSVIPGHEFVGIVHSVGPVTTNSSDDSTNMDSPPAGQVQPGQLVVVEQAVPCGSCWFCQRDWGHKCHKLQIYGQGVDGGMAEYMLVTSTSQCHIVPDHVPHHHAAFVEPMAIGVHAVDQAFPAIRDGRSMPLLDGTNNKTKKEEKRHQAVAIVGGCGAIGAAVIAALKYAYGDNVKVIAVETDESKLKLARKAGADLVFHVTEPGQYCLEELEKRIAEEVPEKGGCDVYFECAGSSMGITQGLTLCRKMGMLVHLGIWHGGEVTTGANWNIISAMKELTVVGSSLGGARSSKSWERAVQIIAEGAVPMDDIVTHVLPLERVHEAHQMAMNGGSGSERGLVKCVVELL